jgi:hypothetical protein
MIVRCILWTALLSTVCASGLAAEEPGVHRKSFLGKPPPELAGEKEHWLGKSPPMTLRALRGKVVWLQFNF